MRLMISGSPDRNSLVQPHGIFVRHRTEAGESAPKRRGLGSKTILILLCGLFLPFSVEGPNSDLALAAIVVLATGGVLLLRSREPPILFFVFFYQWVQTSISLFASNVDGIPVEAFGSFHGDAARAIILSLAGITILAIGSRLGMGPQSVLVTVRAIAVSRKSSEWFFLYLLAVSISSFVLAFAYVMPGLSQPLLAVASLKWAFFWVLAYVYFLRSSGSTKYFWVAFFLELGLGFGGYFSDFKTVIFVSLLAAGAAEVRISPQNLIGLGLLAAMLVSLGLIWTAIKSDYRNYVNGGLQAQVVHTSYSDSLGKIVELTSRLDERALSTSRDQLLRRLSYVEFFGLVLTRVPRVVPFEQGALWWDAISRPFMPRLLFPAKSVIDDSVRTRIYTGAMVSGTKEGSSVSIGYIAEAYIDFGAFGMMVPIFALGYFYGRIYRWLAFGPKSKGPLGMGLAVAVLYFNAPLETSITKTVGALVVILLVVWLALRYFVPKYIPWVLTSHLIAPTPSVRPSPIANNQ